MNYITISFLDFTLYSEFVIRNINVQNDKHAQITLPRSDRGMNQNGKFFMLLSGKKTHIAFQKQGHNQILNPKYLV